MAPPPDWRVDTPNKTNQCIPPRAEGERRKHCDSFLGAQVPKHATQQTAHQKLGATSKLARCESGARFWGDEIQENVATGLQAIPRQEQMPPESREKTLGWSRQKTEPLITPRTEGRMRKHRKSIRGAGGPETRKPTEGTPTRKSTERAGGVRKLCA